MSKPIPVTAVIDEDGNEALYVNGQLWDFEGETLYACDIADAVDGLGAIKFTQVHVELPDSAWESSSGNEFETFDWPERFEDLQGWIVSEESKEDQP